MGKKGIKIKKVANCTCRHCGNKFYRFKCHKNRRQNNFCNLECRVAFNKAKVVQLKCGYCGKEFVRLKTETRKNKHGKNYCSRECACLGNSERVKVKIKCDWCGKVIIRKKGRVGKLPHHFCDRKCCYKWKSKHLIREKSPTWKGGRYHTTDGYIKVYAFEHPNNVTGYVWEHRLVMEKKLGRYLTKDEIVHHLNGIKDDNREENLLVTTRKRHENGTLVKLYTERIRELESIVKGIYVCPN